MLRCVFILFLLLSSGAPQEFGDFGPLLEMRISRQVMDMLYGVCCVIRHLMCPARQGIVTMANSNVPDLPSEVLRFENCLCLSGVRCTLNFPAQYLPDAANGGTYNVTFITVTTIKRYLCTYRNVATLDCLRRDMLDTGLAQWGLASDGSSDVGSVASFGAVGEDMEEMMEQMMEAGIPLNMGNHDCKLCVPLRCALAVASGKRTNSGGRVDAGDNNCQRRYHNCLRLNGVPIPRSYTTIRTPPTTTVATTTPDRDDDEVIQITSTSRRTTVTIRPSSSTSRQTTAFRIFTPRHDDALQPIVTQPTVLTSHKTTFKETIELTTRPSQNTPTSISQMALSSLPQEIIRQLVPFPVDSSKLQTATLKGNPRQIKTADITKFNRSQTGEGIVTPREDNSVKTSGGSSRDSAIIVGSAVAVAVVAAFLLFFLIRHQRRRRNKKHATEDGVSVSATKKSITRVKTLNMHRKTKSLPSVSSKRTVIDAEGDTNVESDEEYENDRDYDENDDDKRKGQENPRYVPEHVLFSLHTTPAATVAKEPNPDETSIYAALDESAMIPTHHLPAVSSAGHVTSTGRDRGRGLQAGSLSPGNARGQQQGDTNIAVGMCFTISSNAPLASFPSSGNNSAAGPDATLIASVHNSRQESPENNEYETPRLSGQDHEYMALAYEHRRKSSSLRSHIETSPFGPAAASTDDYLHPCLTPRSTRKVSSQRSNRMVKEQL